MALFGSFETVRSQLARTALFEAAFAYTEDWLRAGSPAQERHLALPTGEALRTDLTGGMFALAQVYPTKPRAEARFESHRRYIDIQVMLAGEEFMAVTDRSRLVVTEDLTPGQDLIFYRNSEAASLLRLDRPGATAVYFPADAHMGAIMTGAAPALVRKLVIKVPV